MSYNDTASHRSYGRSNRGRDDYYDDRGDYRDAYREDRSDRRSDRGRDAYYDQEPPADNSALARRQQLPAAYYNKEPSVRSSGRSNRARSRSRSRSRSRTPPSKKAASRRNEIVAGVAGAIALTAADKFLIEPRMNKGKGKGQGHGRSKSHHEALRRAADVGVGGLAGSQIYRAVSRSRVRQRAKSVNRRGGSPDSRGRSESRGRSSSRDSRDRSRSKSKGAHWKTLFSTGAGALAGLAAEQIKKRSDSQKGRSKSRGGRDYSDDDSDRSRSSRRSRTRGGGGDDDKKSRRRRSHSDDSSGGDDRDRRDRRRDRDRGSRNENPHEGRDLEAIGLIGVAQGLQGKHKKKAALETAIGAAGLAQNYYERHKATHPPTAKPPR